MKDYSLSPMIERHARWMALVIVLIGFMLRVWHPGSIYFNIHAERDFWRTLQLLQGDAIPYTGSELTQGGRTMGPALYWMQAPPLSVSLDPRAMLVWLALLHAGAIFLTYRIGAENFSRATGLAASALFATFPLAVLALRYVWNPSFIFPLSTLFYWSVMGVFFRGKWNRLPIAIAAWGLLFQVHLSALVLLVGFIAGFIIFRPQLPRKWLLISAATFLLVFSPYIIGEMTHGFANTRAILIPPPKLTTANGAEIPIVSDQRRRVRFNVGAMKALQVALSPVFYDRRYETGSFSYLNLLAEFGPLILPRGEWQFVSTLHRLRWGYVAGFMGALGMAVFCVGNPRSKLPASLFSQGKNSPEVARSRALWLLIAVIAATVPMLITTTMAAPKDGNTTVGVGAVRYFFVLYPLPFLLWALVLRGAVKAIRRNSPALAHPAGLGVIGAVCMLQSAVVFAHLEVSNKKGRSLKYSNYETYDWTTITAAAEFLIRDWGVSPEQFRTHIFTLPAGYNDNYFLFNSQRHDIASLEQGLDWAFFMNKFLDVSAPAKYPGAYILIYDASYPPPDLKDYPVEEEHRVNELVLARVSNGTPHEISPIQNTWEKITRAKRLSTK